jgi:hypothetical protein
MLVVVGTDGKLVDCTVTSPGGHRVLDARRPLVACNKHTEAEIENALANCYPGAAQAENHEDN